MFLSYISGISVIIDNAFPKLVKYALPLYTSSNKGKSMEHDIAPLQP